MQLRYSLAAFCSAVALAFAAPAHAQFHRHHRDDGRVHYNDVYRHGEGPRYGQYGSPNDGARGYFGHRGDDRWRYYDGARPADSGGPFWYGGPPYDSQMW